MNQFMNMPITTSLYMKTYNLTEPQYCSLVDAVLNIRYRSDSKSIGELWAEISLLLEDGHSSEDIIKLMKAKNNLTSG